MILRSNSLALSSVLPAKSMAAPDCQKVFHPLILLVATAAKFNSCCGDLFLEKDTAISKLVSVVGNKVYTCSATLLTCASSFQCALT